MTFKNLFKLLNNRKDLDNLEERDREYWKKNIRNKLSVKTMNRTMNPIKSLIINYHNINFQPQKSTMVTEMEKVPSLIIL